MAETWDVAAVGAHPDVLEIICGGTLAKKARQGYTVGIIDLTTGEPTPRGTVEIRMKEAEAARQALGVQYRVNLGLPNRELMDGPPARYALATELRRRKPKLLIGVAGRTPAASPDHHQAHLIIEAARFYSQLTKWDDRFGGTAPWRIPQLVYAPFPFDAEARPWHATMVVDVTETTAAKIESMRVYESQFDAARFAKVEQFVRGAMQATGSKCGFAFGEMFALPTPVPVHDLPALMSGGSASPAPVALPGQGHLPFG